MQRFGIRLLAALISVSLAGGPLFAATATPAKQTQAAPVVKGEFGPVTYAELSEYFMRSMGLFDQDPDDTPANPKLNKKVNLDIPELERQEKLTRLFTLMAEQEATLPAAKPTLMHSGIRAALKDLDMFYGQGESYGEHVFRRVNRTKTEFGELALAQMIANPLTDVTKLRARQAFVKELVANPALFAELDALVAQVKESESEIFSFSVEENRPTKELINKMYFGSSKGLNKSPAALEVLNQLGNLGTGIMIGMPVILPAAATCGYVWWSKKSIADTLNEQAQSAGRPAATQADIDAAIKAHSDMYQRTQGIPFGYASMAKHVLVRWLNPMFFTEESIRGQNPEARLGLGRKWGLVAYGAVHAIPLYIAKNGYERGKQRMQTMNYLQSRLIGVATLINNLKSMDDIATAQATMGAGLMTRDKMSALFNNSTDYSAEFNQLIDLLQTDTFKGDASFFSLNGRVLAANTLMNKVKHELMGALETFGEVDACLSIAKLYKEYENSRVHYAFVEYVDRSTPYLNLQDFWNPLVDPNVVVTNNLELGGVNGARDVILTGANTGGKSTILKAMIIDLLLAQALTIGAGSSISMTPFYYFGSSLNKSDDTAAGFSLYQAEVNAAKAMLKAGSLLKDGQFGMLVIDELFRGTSPEQAEQGSYDCAKQLLGYKNVMFILATHFTKLTTTLEKETGGVCKNYKVEIFKEPVTGALVKPYKLEPGVNSTHVASDILNIAMHDIRKTS